MAVTDCIALDYKTAFASPDPVRALRRAVAREVDGYGVPRDEMLASLEGHRLALRASGRESEEDAVTAVMEFLVGWCSPQARI